MATHLDLEEQEQLDQFKHFWNRWGNLITGLLTAVLLTYAAYNGWNYWQQRQATQAAVLYDTFEKSARDADLPLMGRSLADLQNQFGRTTYAQQAALLSARIYANKANLPEAEKSLQWVIDKGQEEGYVALARLRASALAMEQKTSTKPKPFCKVKKHPLGFSPCLTIAWAILLFCKTSLTRPKLCTSALSKVWKLPTNTAA
jgi:predicted negative regulator of RcsB-dependent stress response